MRIVPTPVSNAKLPRHDLRWISDGSKKVGRTILPGNSGISCSGLCSVLRPVAFPGQLARDRSFSKIGNCKGFSLHRALNMFPDSPHDLLVMIDLNLQLGKAKFLIALAPGACLTIWTRIQGDNAVEGQDIGHVLDQLCESNLLNTSDVPANRDPI